MVGGNGVLWFPELGGWMVGGNGVGVPWVSGPGGQMGGGNKVGVPWVTDLMLPDIPYT